MPPVMGLRGLVTICGSMMGPKIFWPVVGPEVMTAMVAMLVEVGRLVEAAGPALAAGMVGRGMIAAVGAFETAAVTPAVGPGIPTDEKNRCNCRHYPLDRSFFHDSPLACCVPRPMMSNHCGTVCLV